MTVKLVRLFSVQPMCSIGFTQACELRSADFIKYGCRKEEKIGTILTTRGRQGALLHHKKN